MSGAREWLRGLPLRADEDDKIKMRYVLLAVLDECDQIIDGIDTPHQRLESVAYMHTGMAAAVSRVRATIDKALGLDGCACGHPRDMHGPEAPGCVECECEYIREGVTNE